jgi:hypothetical protein
MRERPNEPKSMTDDDLYSHLAKDAGLTQEEFTQETGIDPAKRKPTDTAVSSFAPD